MKKTTSHSSERTIAIVHQISRPFRAWLALMAVIAALFASSQLASATTTNIFIQFASDDGPLLVSDTNYWNLAAFGKGGGFGYITNALDTTSNSTGININGSAEGRTEIFNPGPDNLFNNWITDSGGSSFDINVDLPDGTFDIGLYNGDQTVTSITGDSFSGITGPTSVTITFTPTDNEFYNAICYGMTIARY